MSFQKDFDELLNNILTNYQNQLPQADISQGSLIFIKSACIASALWGLYKYQDWISKQLFPDTADTENLDHHAWVQGLSRTYNETDGAYLARLLDDIRRPPAGGNQYDYIKWALSIDNVAAAYCFPLAQGLGSVDVVILANEANTGSEVPSDYESLTGSNDSLEAGKLMDSGTDFSAVKKGDIVKNITLGTETTAAAAGTDGEITLIDDIFISTPHNYQVDPLTQTVKDYIDTVRPVSGASTVRVLAPTPLSQDVTMVVTGANANKPQIISDITDFMTTLTPGQVLYKSQLIAIALDNGAVNASVSTPANDVTPEDYEIIRPGTINVT